MNPRTSRNSFTSCLKSNRTIQEVHDRSHQSHRNESCKSPVNNEGQKWKSENIKTDVHSELRIVNTKRLRVSKEQPVLPLRYCRKSNNQSKKSRYDNSQETRAVTDDQTKTFNYFTFWTKRKFARGQTLRQRETDE